MSLKVIEIGAIQKLRSFETTPFSRNVTGDMHGNGNGNNPVQFSSIGIP